VCVQVPCVYILHTASSVTERNKNDAPTGAGARADLGKKSASRKAFSNELAASDTTCKLTAAHCGPHFYTIAWTAT
jgi:hypothetical protein